MAAFYKSSEGYAHQQATHSAAYFDRLLGVLDAVVTQPEAARARDRRGVGRSDARISREAAGRACSGDGTVAGVHRFAQQGGPASLRSVAGSALQLPFRDRSLDAVVAFEVIEHLPDVALALEEMLRVVERPGSHHHRLAESRIAVDAARRSAAAPRSARVRRRARPSARGDGGSETQGLHGGSDSRTMREFLYREPILHAAAGGDADAVYYAAPIDLMRFFRRRGATLVTSSARVRLGWAGRFFRLSCKAPRSSRGA